MKRAMRAIPLTQEHDYIGEFHMATKKQIYKHMKLQKQIFSVNLAIRHGAVQD